MKILSFLFKKLKRKSTHQSLPLLVPCGIVGINPNRTVYICIVSELSLSAPLLGRCPINAKNEIKGNYPSQHPVGMILI